MQTGTKLQIKLVVLVEEEFLQLLLRRLLLRRLLLRRLLLRRLLLRRRLLRRLLLRFPHVSTTQNIHGKGCIIVVDTRSFHLIASWINIISIPYQECLLRKHVVHVNKNLPLLLPLLLSLLQPLLHPLQLKA